MFRSIVVIAVTALLVSLSVPLFGAEGDRAFTPPLPPANPYPMLLPVDRPKEFPPSPPRANPIRVLIFTGGHDFKRREFFEVFSGQPDITWREVSHPDAYKWLRPDKDGEYDVLVWYDRPMEISPQDQQIILDLLKRGKPLLALHHNLDSMHNWPEAIKILGGRYHREPWGSGQPASTYKPDVTMHVKIADPRHPLTRGMTDFDVVEESYLHCEVLPEVKPLLIVEHPDSDRVIAWTHRYANSPVIYIRPGHGPSTFGNKSYRRLVQQAIRFSAGRLPDPSDEGFVELFNGKNLDNWKIVGDPQAFIVHDGLLTSIGGLDGQWLRSRRVYGDFILRVQWRLSECGNSGVFLRTQDETAGLPWRTGTEVQITNRDDVMENMHCSGALYGLVPVEPRPQITSFQWHEYEVQCRGPHYQVFVDNVPVIDVDARQVPPLWDRPLAGYIGLQDAHSYGWIQFRRAAIKELTPVYAGGWRLGIQAYTFRKFTFAEVVAKAKSLGLKSIELLPGQALSPQEPNVLIMPESSPPAVLDKVKRILLEAGLAAPTMYYGGFKNDETKARQVFEFAKVMGVETIVCEPDFEDFDMLDRLTVEYALNVAVHNHVKGSQYGDPQIVLEQIKGRNRRIGACPDVGHWGRSGLDTVAALKLLEGRIICLHVKDVDAPNTPQRPGEDVIWGRGVSNIKGVLTELHRQKFAGQLTIEYEANWDNNVPDVAECIKFYEGAYKAIYRP